VTTTRSVHRRIADTARAGPDRTALIGFDTTLTEVPVFPLDSNTVVLQPVFAPDKIPKQFTFVDQVPRSAAGKIQRWRLASPHENGATPP
jgi:acyl-CoA synthetase (AMP-forming)/AMP-acid ligase II